MLGVNAMAGTILAAVLLSFYVIWLIRLAPAYGELSRMTGNITVRFIGLFFLLYVILSAAFLADLLAKVIPQSLISGISGKWLSLLAVAACSLGAETDGGALSVWERTGECREEEGLQKFPEGFFWQGFSFL